MTTDDQLLSRLGIPAGDEPTDDAYDCGLVISNPQGLSIIQGKYNDRQAELQVLPKRFWHEGPHDLSAVLNRYRQSGYRVEFVGQEEDNRLYTIIRAHLILSSENLVRMMMTWMNRQ